MITVIGVDPAPSKAAALCVNGVLESRPASVLRERIREMSTTAEANATLIAWDAPLSFSSTKSFYDRPIDLAAHLFVGMECAAGRMSKGAVSSLPFAGCSHWAITSHVLGLPSSSSEPRWRMPIIGTHVQSGLFAIEVHPAVALAVWWKHYGVKAALPRYKKRTGAVRQIATELSALSIPVEAQRDSDALDAWVAYRLASDFLGGDARWVGAVADGGYVLPCLSVTDEIETYLAKAQSAFADGSAGTLRYSGLQAPDEV